MANLFSILAKLFPDLTKYLCEVAKYKVREVLIQGVAKKTPKVANLFGYG